MSIVPWIKYKDIKCENCTYYTGTQCHGHGEYYGSCKLAEKIKKLLELETDKILVSNNLPEFIYDESTKIPEVTIIDEALIEWEEEIDYTCEYVNNIQPGKAKVIIRKIGNETELNLYSYGTLVARIETYKNSTRYTYLGKYRQTTTRHQKEFFKQNDLSDKEIKKLFKNGTIVKEVE